MEDDDGGMLRGGETLQWEWGTPVARPLACHGGLRCWGTVLGGFYLNDAEDWIQLPGVDLASIGRPVLSGWHWYDIESGDAGWVEVDRGFGWETQDPVYGYPSGEGYAGASDGWEPFWVDLEGVADASQVRFVFRSNPAVANAGWFIDDLEISHGDVIPPSVVATVCPEDTDDIEGPYIVEAIVTDDVGVDGAWILWTVNGGTVVTSAMSVQEGDLYSGPVAGQDPGSTVEVWVEASDGLNVIEARDQACAFRVRLPPPTGLTGPSERIWGLTAPLSWNPPESRHDVEGYRVYRDGVPIMDTVEPEADAPLETGVQGFTVTALYEVGEGDPSDPFEVLAAVPTLDALDPMAGFQGDLLRVRMEGRFLLLVQDEARVQLGDGVKIASVDVRDVDVAYLTVAILYDARPGPRDLQLETGGLTVRRSEAFEVLGGADRPRLLDVQPDDLQQGEGATLTIRASEPFESVPEVTIGDEVVVDAVERTDAGDLRVEVAVPFTAALGPHPVEVDDGTRILGGLDVTVAPRVSGVSEGCPGCGARPGRGSLLAALLALLAVWRRR